MALKKVIYLAGQSNADGAASRDFLPPSLRGPQANTFIFNYENNAIEILNVDGVGLNLPNNTTVHFSGACGPETALCAKAVAELGEIYLFKFALGGTSLGPSPNREWNFESQDLFAEWVTRHNAFVAAMALLGHTIDPIVFIWDQGEDDYFVEGNDLAYYGLFLRFIKEIRLRLIPFTALQKLRWVTSLTHTAPVSVAFQQWISPQKNVRAAQRRAGWSDPEYRIIDSDRFSHGGAGVNPGDTIHLDTLGQVSSGEALWDAYKLPYNNSMALQDYNLLELRTNAAEEFGIDLSIQKNAVTLDRKINDSLAWILNRRKNWPWLERIVSVNVGEKTASVKDKRYGAGIFTVSSDSVNACSFNLSTIEARELVSFDSQYLLAQSFINNTIQLRQKFRGDSLVCDIIAIIPGNPTIIAAQFFTTLNGSRVLPVNVPTFGVLIQNNFATPGPGSLNGTYQATRIDDNVFSIPFNSIGLAWIVAGYGTAQIAREFTISQGYFELPDDFIRESTFYIDSAIEENTLSYMPTNKFEREIRTNRVLTSSLCRIFTIIADPLNISNRKYAAVYPYFTDRQTLHMKYYGDFKKLISDLDEPDIPRSDRFVVLCAAMWFIAQWQKDLEMSTFYKNSALNELERMAKEYQLSDDTTESHIIDNSNLGPIRGPDNFPEFPEP